MIEWSTYSHQNLSYSRLRKLGEMDMDLLLLYLCRLAEGSIGGYDFVHNARKTH